MPLAMLVASCTFTSCQPDEPQVSDLKKALQSMDLISAIEANPDIVHQRLSVLPRVRQTRSDGLRA